MWPRVVALLFAVLSISVFGAGVLMAVPALMLLVARAGQPSFRRYALALLALLIVIGGVRDGVWYVERAWAVLVGGWFVAFTMARPSWPLSSRAIASVFGSFGVAAAVLAVSGGWASLDWAVADRMTASVTATLDAAAVLREGQAVGPALAGAMYEMVAAQITVFPAMVGLGSAAALAIAWWVVGRFAGQGDETVGPMARFRFNDHLVWLMVGGLLLVVTRWGDTATRVGANMVVFMGALYALRGAAVVMHVSGGLTLVGYGLLALTLVFGAPVVLGVAVMIGIGDTWLDLRARARKPAA